MSTETSEMIKLILRKIPRGKVASYGSVAAAAGLYNGARQVVRILHATSASENLPWHRVVKKDGSIALPPQDGGDLQRSLLEAEGISFSPTGKIDLSTFGYRFKPFSKNGRRSR